MNAVLAKLRDRAQANRRYRCPTAPEHGFLLAWSGVGGAAWYCPHFGHDGRGRGHPEGLVARTSPFFTQEQAERGLEAV